MNLFTKLITLLLIAGGVSKERPTLVKPDCPLMVSIETLNDGERERIESEYRNQQKCIVIIFTLGLIMSFGIVIELGAPSNWDFAVRGFNLLVKSLSLMITIFLPAVLLDAIYFTRKGKNNTNPIDFKFEMTKMGVMMFTFYVMVMFSNLEYWVKELYNCQEYSVALVNQLEKRIGIMGVATLVISALFIFMPGKMKNVLTKIGFLKTGDK